MKSYQFLYDNEENFKRNLSQIKEQIIGIPYFYLAWTDVSDDDIRQVTKSIDTLFPESIYYGSEASWLIVDGNLAYGIAVTCCVFELESSQVELQWVEKGTKFDSLESLWEYCRQKNGLKAVELIPSISYVEILQLDKNVPELSDDILVFGGASVGGSNVESEAKILAKGHSLSLEGMAVVLYFGESLHLSGNYILGWKALGKNLTITKSHDKIIEEIDNAPAHAIYEKYLGLKEEDNDNLVFPLMVEEDGTEFIRTPQMFLQDNTMQMFAKIEEGATARLSYGDKNTIMNSLFEKATEIANFCPDVLKAFSCTARKMFWGDDANREILPLSEIAPISGNYTGGEILRINGKIRVMNSTLVVICFREGKLVPEKIKNISFNKKDRSIVSRVTYFVEVVANELEEALEMANSANRAKTEFLFNMSHDIRTPMNAILGFTNIAKKHIDDKEKVLDCLSKTEQSGELLLSLINNILEVSRIEFGKAVLDEENADVMFSFINIEDTMSIMAEAKDISLTFEYRNIVDRYVKCDFNRCARIFVNIISNAIKYTNEGGYVKVICEQIGEAKDGIVTYQYSFEDNGIGMSADFQRHVFEQFSREKSATLTGIQGTGLGMSVCKSFVDLMNGTIECKSELGKGTTVIVTLPFKLRDSDVGAQDVKNVSHNRYLYEYKSMDFKGKKVLLAEDNELNREIAVELLEDEGIEVDEAEDGTNAVELMKEKGPDYYDIILMDIQMPVMGGYEATRKIREMYPDKKIPIIALSANAFAEDKTASANAGMDDHVAKPIDTAMLFKVMKKHLKKKYHR